MKSVYWTVAATKGSDEERAAHHVERQGFKFYLPRIVMHYGSRSKREFLFPGYIFIQINKHWHSLFGTRGIRHLFMCSGMPTRMPDSDMVDMRSRENDDGLVELPPPLRIGDHIEVTGTGPFNGKSGVLKGMLSRDRCFVLLNMLGRSTPVMLNRKVISLSN